MDPKHAKLNGSKFQKDKEHLDVYVKELYVLLYKYLPFAIKIILTMNHEKRGFNIKSALKTNVSPKGVIVKNLVKDHLLVKNLKLHTIKINNPMVRAFKGACQSYAIYLDDENKKKMQTKGKQKAKHITTDIENLKQKLKTNQKAVSRMENKYMQYMELGEKKRELTFVLKGNGLKIKCDQVKEEIKTTEQGILAHEARKKNLLEK